MLYTTIMLFMDILKKVSKFKKDSREPLIHIKLVYEDVQQDLNCFGSSIVWWSSDHSHLAPEDSGILYTLSDIPRKMSDKLSNLLCRFMSFIYHNDIYFYSFWNHASKCKRWDIRERIAIAYNHLELLSNKAAYIWIFLDPIYARFLIAIVSWVLTTLK